MYCGKCGRELPQGVTVCEACASGQGALPQFTGYGVKAKRNLKNTEKLLLSVFHNMSFVTLGVFIAGAVATLFSFITTISTLFWGNVFINLISGLGETAFYAMITVFITVMLAKIDNKE